MEITNVVDKGSNVVVIIMLTDLWKSTDDLREDFNKERRLEKEPLRAEEPGN